jgi:hypothetical protein
MVFEDFKAEIMAPLKASVVFLPAGALSFADSIKNFVRLIND